MNLTENNLPVNIFEQFDKAKKIVTQEVSSWGDTAQQVSDSWQEAATQTTGKVVDTVVNKFTVTTEQAKDSLGSTFQTAINSSVGNLLEQHPIFLKLAHILVWATNHPIISAVIIIFAIALAFSLIKAVVRLIESASLSILRLPLKFIQAGLKLSFLYISKLIKRLFIKLKHKNSSNLLAKRNINIPNNLTPLPLIESQIFSLSKQQRLREISTRLAEIQKEQHELLQEASLILGSDLNSDLHSNLNPDLHLDLNPDLNPDSNSDKIKQN